MNALKKTGRFLSSMTFALILLVILAGYCTVASFVTQGQSLEWYASAYSERAAGLIVALGLDDAFHSPFFVLLAVLLCLSLLLCNLLRAPLLWRRMKQAGAKNSSGPERGIRARAGLWGAWVTHLGVLLLIIGFSLGQFTKKEYTVYGVPGTSREVGDTGRILTIDDFNVDLREDDTVEQYTAQLTMRDPSDGSAESGEASVNHPATLLGFKCYQNSTGWAARIHIRKDGEDLQDELIYAGDSVAVKDKPELVIQLSAFYPDYVMDPVQGPMSASSKLNNPAYLYMVWYGGQMLGMNALLQEETLTIDEYSVTFSDPQNYSLIQVKEDHFQGVALAGGLITLLGLILAFYVKPGTGEKAGAGGAAPAQDLNSGTRREGGEDGQQNTSGN